MCTVFLKNVERQKCHFGKILGVGGQTTSPELYKGAKELEDLFRIQ